MKTKKSTITNEQLSKEVEKMFDRAVGSLIKELEVMQVKNADLVKQLSQITLNIEKMNIKEERIYETFLDVMVLVRLHNKKIKDLEKQLQLSVDQ